MTFGKLSLSALVLAITVSTAQAADTLAVLQVTRTLNGSVTGAHLTNSADQTLYTFDPDTAFESNCSGACAEKWPPLLLTNTEICVPPMGFITRPDGLLQATFRGKPLYTYFADRARGDKLGNGLGGVWHIVEVNDQLP